MNTNQVEFRTCQPADAEDVARLSDQLGYAASVAEIESRIRRFREMEDHVVLVACLPGGAVVGWIDVCISDHLQSGASAEIGGLVVAESERSRGIGRMLVAEAEAWAIAQGVRRMRVRSQVKRSDAHRFYLREKYVQIKTSAVFEKAL